MGVTRLQSLQIKRRSEYFMLYNISKMIMNMHVPIYEISLKEAHW